MTFVSGDASPWDLDALLGNRSIRGTPREKYLSADTITTSATPTGGAFVSFASAACAALLITNESGQQIEYRRNGAGNVMPIMPRQTRLILGITDANQIGIRRSDYATARTTQVSAVNAILLDISGALYSAPTIGSLGSFSSGSSQLSNIACAAVEIVNTDEKDLLVRMGSSTAPTISIRARQSLLIDGLTNANQLWLTSADSVGHAAVQYECFTETPHRQPGYYRRPDVLSENCKVFLGEAQMSNSFERTFFASPALASTFKRVRRPGSLMISRFDLVANMLSPASILTDAVTAPDVGFVANTRVRATYTGNNTQNFTSNINAVRSINTQSGNKGSVHVDLKVPSLTKSISVDLFSTGSPSSPGANYHSTTFTAGDFASGWGAAPMGSFGLHIDSFAAVGSGADLTAITFARLRITGSTGDVFEVGDIRWAPNVDTKGKIIFTIDDGKIEALTKLFPVLSRYDYPAVMFPSAGSTSTFNYQTVLPDDMLTLQNRYGWQIGSQEWYKEGSIDMTPYEWLESMCKNFWAAIALGFDTEGLRDGSFYGGGSYYVTAEQLRLAPRLFATYCDFKNGRGATGDGLTPFARPTTFPLANPFAISRLNLSSYSSSDASALATKLQLHVDQANACGGVAVFAMHNDLATANILTAFTTMVEYIRTQELVGLSEVVTLKQLRQRL